MAVWRRRPTCILAAVTAAVGMAVPLMPIRASAVTTLTVTATADLAPPCAPTAYSLRCAITQANIDGAGDTVGFHIPEAAPGCAGVPTVCTIMPLKALPHLTASSTVINGGSQPGATLNANPLAKGDNAVITVRLDGSRAGKGADGLDLFGAGDTVEGLSITGFIVCFSCTPTPGQETGGSGIGLEGRGDVVAGDFLGVQPDGRTASPNQFAGVEVGASSPNAGHEVIGGPQAAQTNVISGNKSCISGDCQGSGVYVWSGSGTVIERSLIGTTAAGHTALANTAGAVVLSAGNQVGGGTRATGNVISGSYGDGVLLGAGDTVVGNLIGLDAAGSSDVRNRSHGIDAQSTGVIIRGNVISANGDTGVVLSGGSTVQGNLIGTDATGKKALGNGLHPSAFFLGQPINGTDGIVTCAGSNLIGGTAAGDGNVVAASGGDGISLVSDANVVEGNRVGTDAGGDAALGNKVDGIGTRSNTMTGTGFCQQALNAGGNRNQIGGSAAGAGNLISGNGVDGVDLVASDGGVITGNRIGTNAGATAAVGNAGHGVELGPLCDGSSCGGSSNNVIGGTTKGAGNVVAGNGGDGVHIDGGGGGITNAVQGNSIGTNSAGAVSMANRGAGVFVGDGAVNDSVGGTSQGSGNLIAFNAGPGVLIGLSAADSATHIAVRENVVRSNGGLGVDIAPSGAVNCTTAAPGPNDYTACPVLTSASTTSVSGRACAGCTVEVFRAATASDDQGHGEAAAFLGSSVAGANGLWTLTLSPGQLSAGNGVTATATTPPSFQKAAETSEFAANVIAA